MEAAKAQPGSRITTVPNMRDLGLWSTRGGGRVRPRLLYRSAELSRLSDDKTAALAGFGLRSVYDLRTEEERSRQPDRIPEGVDYTVLDILEGAAHLAPARLLDVLSDPKAADDMLGGGKAVAMFEEAYREVVDLPSALSGYNRFFSAISRRENVPALFHCTTGKDRTGWAAAALLLLLGVADDLVMEEYMLTNEQLLPALEPLFEQFESAGGDRELLIPVVGVRESYLLAALDEMKKRFGTIEGYFTGGLGFEVEALDTLREAFTESG